MAVSASLIWLLPLVACLRSTIASATLQTSQPAVDLVVTATLPLDAALLPGLWRSVDLFWRPYVGKHGGSVVLACVDCTSDALASLAHRDNSSGIELPEFVQFVAVEGPRCLHPYVRHQWSTFEAARFGTAPIIALTDSDGIFHTPVTHDTLMESTREGDRRPFVLRQPGDGSGLAWTAASRLLLGDTLVPHGGVEHNYMVALPFVVHRQSLLNLRQHVEANARLSWDKTFCSRFASLQDFSSLQAVKALPCNFCLLGQFLASDPKELSTYSFREEAPSSANVLLRVMSHVAIDSGEPGPCIIGQDSLSRAVAKAGHPKAFSIDYQKVKLQAAGKRVEEVEAARCYSPEGSRQSSCRELRCSHVFFPLLAWQGSKCWGGMAQESQLAAWRAYAQAVGVADDEAARSSACGDQSLARRFLAKGQSHSQDGHGDSLGQGMGCTCSELQRLQTHVQEFFA